MYKSTRSNNLSIHSSTAIVNGLANDNGLYIPIVIPKIEDSFENLSNLTYKELALYILKYYLDDFTEEEIKYCIDKAYDLKFENNLIAPILKKGEVFFLELFHGPTLAFKDIALSLFPYLLKMSAVKNNIKNEIIILVATSGDTGKASLEALKNIDGIKVIVFYPKYGVSSLQEIQMLTQEGYNTFVVGLNGNFDDAQCGVKSIFDDINFKNTLNKYTFSSANSINIGRLLPQIIYYFYSYFTLFKNGDIKLNDKVNFVVPTGNFGNILAGYYSKEMGLPINKLICSSNENNILTDFINSGIYDKNRKLIVTSSPSMDILVSSNVERLLYELSNRDSSLVNSFMKNLSQDGYYEIPSFMKERLQSLFYGDFATNEETTASIKEVYSKYDYLIDPHTAVAYSVYDKYSKKSKDTTPTIILSTASPFKFPEAINKSIDISKGELEPFNLINEISNRTHTPIPNSIITLNNKSIIHHNTCEKGEMREVLYNLLKVGEKNDKD